MVLRNSEALQRLAAVVRDSRDAILMQDMTGRILAWNHGAEQMYGWTEGEALALNIRDLMTKDNQEQTLAAIRQQCVTGGLDTERTQRVTKDGRTLQVSLIVSPLVNDAGETYAIATTERGMAP
jgi:two-component system CheB/CheR fusion protein